MSNESPTGEEHGPFRSVPFVADRLRWHERTIRRHLVPVTTFLDGMRRAGRTVEAHTWETGEIPSVRLGVMYRIPVWWLTAVLGAGVPPEPGGEG